MANPARLDLVHKAICLGWKGHIQWKPQAYERVRDDPEMQGLTPERIKELLNVYCKGGGQLEVRHETREELLAQDPDNPYWYRALIPVTEGLICNKELFIELILLDDDEEEPWVEIVNSHF